MLSANSDYLKTRDPDEGAKAFKEACLGEPPERPELDGNPVLFSPAPCPFKLDICKRCTLRYSCWLGKAKREEFETFKQVHYSTGRGPYTIQIFLSVFRGATSMYFKDHLLSFRQLLNLASCIMDIKLELPNKYYNIIMCEGKFKRAFRNGYLWTDSE